MDEIHGVPKGLVHGTLSKATDELYIYRYQGGREYIITIDVREHEVSAGAFYDDADNYLEAAGRNSQEALIKVVGRLNLQATMKK